MAEKLLKLSDVEAKTGFKKTWIYARVKAGKFPAPIHIGVSSRWPESLIDEWIAQQTEQAA